MKSLLLIGAGRSAGALIQYLLDNAEGRWTITVTDANVELAAKKTHGHPAAKAAALDVNNVEQRQNAVQNADIVISMLPAHLHQLVAEDCLSFGKHLITASYISKPLEALNEKVTEKGLIFMGEMGLDPGIDHLSAMEKLDEIRSKGGKIQAFRSYTGGLVAAESDDNPWHYKFSWNPRNVILAGQGVAQYLYEGKMKFITYRRLFQEFELIDTHTAGVYEGYANRDSLAYRKHYGLEDCPTILRATFRHKDFCEAWNAFVQLGLTDDTYTIPNSESLTYSDLVNSFLPQHFSGQNPLKERVSAFLNLPIDGQVMSQLEWTGIFEEVKIGLVNATPAQILQNLLEGKWLLKPEDKDLVVMHHIFDYELNGENHRTTSTLYLEGDDSESTAMAKTVGLPMGIFAKMVADGVYNRPGVQIPLTSDVYSPVLQELKNFGVVFVEKEVY